VLAGGFGALAFLWLRAEDQRKGAEAARAEALRAQQMEAEQRQTAQARQAETEAVLDFVRKRVFGAARPKGQEGGLGREVSLRKAVEAALPFVESSFRDQPLTEARLRTTLGSSFFALGDVPLAADQYRISCAIFTKQRGRDDPDTLRSMNGLGVCYRKLGRYAEALKLDEEALTLRKAKLGPDHPDTLRGMNDLADSYTYLGRFAEALKLHEETLALRKATLGPDHLETLRSMNNVANSYLDLGGSLRPANSMQRPCRCAKPSSVPITPTPFGA
jgi:tetratricopeptide (TPR) repeat protein